MREGADGDTDRNESSVYLQQRRLLGHLPRSRDCTKRPCWAATAASPGVGA